MKEKMIKLFSKYQIILNQHQVEQFVRYYNFLVEENKKFNLTAITDEDEVIVKHFLDSVLPINELKVNSSLIDIGTGAGFPGIPIKIIRPDINIVLLDSLQKRVNFLNETINMLGLKNIEAIHGRAEDYAQKNRERFDYAVSRAVAKANTLLEYMLPFVKVGGTALLYKATKVEEELKEAKNAITVLGGVGKNLLVFDIEEYQLTRKVVLINKERKTPIKYPRTKNLPKLKPIL